VESINKQTISTDSLEIIVVDNNSSDGSAEFVEENYQDVILIKNSKNVGHSIACNQGAEMSSGKYLLFLDNDTVLDKNFISELLKVFRNKKDCGIAGGMVKDMGTNFIQEIGINIDYFGYPIAEIGSMFGHFIEDKGQFRDIFETFYVSSCALMIPRNLFFKVGGFDGSFFMYKDDLDLCWRVKLLGYKVYINPKAKIYHKMGVTLGGSSSDLVKGMRYRTTSKKRYFGERNTVRTLVKNYEIKTLLWILPLYLLINIGEAVYFLFKIPSVSKAYFDAWVWNVKNLRDTLEERKRVQSMRKLKDKSILGQMYKGIAKLKTFRNLKNFMEVE